MTPEERTLVENLRREVVELSDRLNKLQSSSEIPLPFDQAFRERFKINARLRGTGTGSASTQSINLSGNAETIVVPAQPSGTVKADFNGTTYELLYK